MNWVNFSPILFGALLGFIFSVCTTLINAAIVKSGKLKVYYKIYSSDKMTEKFGFSSSSNRIAFIVPIKLEIQNTSDTSKVIRDLSVFLYCNGHKLDKMTQVTQTINTITKNGVITERKEKQFGAQNNSYSFVIPPRSIQSENCNFMYVIEQNSIDKNQFNEIKLMYYDESDKEHNFYLRKIENCWKETIFDSDEDWLLAK